MFYKYFPDNPFDIGIVLEKKKYSYKDKKIKVFNNKDVDFNISWSKRLRNALEYIDTKYVFLTIEDAFMNGNTNLSIIKKWINYMENDINICSINSYYYSPNNDICKNVKDDRYEGIERRGYISQFKLSVGVGLWNRKKLIYYLGDNETPWEWEAYSNMRTFLHPNDHFYVLSKNCEYPYKFSYENRKWSPICKGKWFLPECEDFFKKEGINVDYSILGTCDEKDILLQTEDDNKVLNYLRNSKIILFLRMIYKIKFFWRNHR